MSSSPSITNFTLPNRWFPLPKYPPLRKYFNSKSRYIINHAGRRSYKTETAKRILVKSAISHYKYPNSRFIASAPVTHQAKRIYWNDIKSLIPRRFIRTIHETELCIRLFNNALIQVVGMDKPQRIEGDPITFIVLDEYGNMHPNVLDYHIRPALADHKGRVIFVGVPEGRNHYYTLTKYAHSNPEQWEVYHWRSDQFLSREELELAKAHMDPLSYEQEFGGEFVAQGNLAYYTFSQGLHYHPKLHLQYDPNQPLIITLDFNVNPGVAVYLQRLKVSHPEHGRRIYTCAINETHLMNSNTKKVCEDIVDKYSDHPSDIYVYGDSTGGLPHTSQTEGSDWDIVRGVLTPIYGDRLHFRLPVSNPPEKSRVVSVNSHLLSADEQVHFLIDPLTCPHLCEDLEGVVVEPDSPGIPSQVLSGPLLTHLSDALGYYIHYEFPSMKDVVIVSSWR